MPRGRNRQGQISQVSLEQIPVQVTRGTYIDEAAAAVAVGLAAPQIGLSFSSVTDNNDRREPVWQFPAAVASVRAILIPNTGTFVQPDASLDSSSGFPTSLDFVWSIELYTAAFDAATITWDNQPAVVTFGAAHTISWAADDIDVTADALTEASPAEVLTADLSAGGPFFGCKINIDSFLGIQLEDFAVAFSSFPLASDAGRAVLLIPTLA